MFVLLSFLTSKCFKGGLSTPSFSELGIFPLNSDVFAISVSTSKTLSRLSFNKVVGQRSRLQEEFKDSLTISHLILRDRFDVIDLVCHA